MTCPPLVSPTSYPSPSIHIRYFNLAIYAAFLNALCSGILAFLNASPCVMAVSTHSSKYNSTVNLSWMPCLTPYSLFWIVCLSSVSHSTLGMPLFYC